MDQPDGDRAFTDRRRHAFDRATPYVTDSEDARPAGLEHASVAVPGRSGEHEPFLVQRYLPVEPSGVRHRPDQQEQCRRVDDPPLVSCKVVDLDRCHGGVPEEFGYLTTPPDLHPRRTPDPVGEIAGHVPVEVAVADHQVHRRRPPGQEDRRLTSGVTAADDGHGVTPAELRLALGRCVVHAGCLETLHTRDVQPLVVDARRQDHRVRGQLLTIGES